MNSLYPLGVRQTSSMQADLERLLGGDTSASLQGLSYGYPCVWFLQLTLRALLGQGRYPLHSPG